MQPLLHFKSVPEVTQFDSSNKNYILLWTVSSSHNGKKATRDAQRDSLLRFAKQSHISRLRFILDLDKLNYLVSSLWNSKKSKFLYHRARVYLFQQQIILKEVEVTILLITFK